MRKLRLEIMLMLRDGWEHEQFLSSCLSCFNWSDNAAGLGLSRTEAVGGFFTPGSPLGCKQSNCLVGNQLRIFTGPLWTTRQLLGTQSTNIRVRAWKPRGNPESDAQSDQEQRLGWNPEPTHSNYQDIDQTFLIAHKLLVPTSYLFYHSPDRISHND